MLTTESSTLVTFFGAAKSAFLRGKKWAYQSQHNVVFGIRNGRGNDLVAHRLINCDPPWMICSPLGRRLRI